MIGYYAEVAPDGKYLQCLTLELPSMEALVPGDPRNTLQPVSAPPASWAGSTQTEVLHLVDGSEVWVESLPLEELKLRKNDEINSSREHANTDTFEYMGKLIRCRPLDRGDIDGTNGYIALFGTFPDGWQGGWKAADNTVVPIPTITEWKAFYKAMVDTGNRNFKRAQTLKTQLADATTAEAVQAIVW